MNRKSKQDDMVIHVRRSRQPFFIVENKVLNDESLSIEGKWVYCCIRYLLDAEEECNSDNLLAVTKYNLDQLNRCLDELKERGHML